MKIRPADMYAYWLIQRKRANLARKYQSANRIIQVDQQFPSQNRCYIRDGHKREPTVLHDIKQAVGITRESDDTLLMHVFDPETDDSIN
jgi:hypothetical protein